jgi:GTP-binding protein
MQQHWRALMHTYFERRRSLVGVFLIMDARRPLLDFDRLMLEWTQSRRLPVHLVITKADKLSRSDANVALQRVRRETAAYASSQLLAAPAKRGVDEARDMLDAMYQQRWQPAAQQIESKKNPGDR